MQKSLDHENLTTRRYHEDWIIFNPGKENHTRSSFEGIVKFYEHCWWAGVALRPRLVAIDGSPTFVIEAEIAIVCGDRLRERYPYLEEVCQILDNGLTYFQSDVRS